MSKTTPKWQPLRRAFPKPASEELIATMMREYDVDAQKAREMMDQYEKDCTVWINDIYQVQVRRVGEHGVHLNIRRRDGGPILRDWRHFQQIKNELIGRECEAVELYPAESRKWDEGNKYHLFGYLDGSRFPVGFEGRSVHYGDGKAPGLRQRGQTMLFPTDGERNNEQ